MYGYKAAGVSSKHMPVASEYENTSLGICWMKKLRPTQIQLIWSDTIPKHNFSIRFTYYEAFHLIFLPNGYSCKSSLKLLIEHMCAASSCHNMWSDV